MESSFSAIINTYMLVEKTKWPISSWWPTVWREDSSLVVSAYTRAESENFIHLDFVRKDSKRWGMRKPFNRYTYSLISFYSKKI